MVTAQNAKKKHWGFMHNPTPKAIHKRMKAANLSRSAMFVYMHIVESLNGNTKSGWTISQTDSYIGQELNMNEWSTRTARRELVDKDFVEQRAYAVNGKRVVGTWIFRLKQTEPYCKTTVDKYKNQHQRNCGESDPKIVEFPTGLCRESPQENVANRYIKSELPPPEEPVIIQASANEEASGKDSSTLSH